MMSSLLLLGLVLEYTHLLLCYLDVKVFVSFFNSAVSAKSLRWHMFKQLRGKQGVEKLLSTPGYITKHILRAHLQANVWLQDIVAEPALLDPLSLGWQQLGNGHYSPIVSRVPAAPEAVVELVKCSCVTSKCSGWCSCKAPNLACTELCKCEGVEDACSNIVIDQNSSLVMKKMKNQTMLYKHLNHSCYLVCSKTSNILKISFWQPI